MNEQKIPILLNCIAAILGAGGQYFYKKGAATVAQNPLNFSILLGVLMFIGVMALFVVGYKLGGKISVVYPFYATTFVWGALIGVMFENETMVWQSYAGLGLVLAGLALIASQVSST